MAVEQDTGFTALPDNPFEAPRYHFGMLLGVDDFEAEQGHHRGKHRLHQSWLHGGGVVWGLGVSLDLARGEIRVAPGLALDGSGRELRLDAPACVGLGPWFDRHAEDPDLVVTEDGSARVFDVHVIARFRACLARPVPALREPCEGATRDTAYSRFVEGLQLELRPAAAPAVPPPASHRLLLLLDREAPRPAEGGGIDPDDAALLAARDTALALPPAERAAAWRALLAEAAARDAADRAPPAVAEDTPATPYAVAEPADLALGEVLGVRLEPAPGGGWTVTAGTVRIGARATLLPTALLQGLVADAPPPPADAGGPRFDPAASVLEDTRLTLSVGAPLLDTTVTAAAFALSQFDATTGWSVLATPVPTYDPVAGTVTLEPAAAFAGTLVRVIARGTGPEPLLGADGVPLAGARGGPPGSRDEGHDFVQTITRTQP